MRYALLYEFHPGARNSSKHAARAPHINAMNLTRRRLTVGVLWAAFAGLALYFVFTLDLRPLRLDEIFTILMGSKVDPRKEFIEKYAKTVRWIDV